MAKKEVLINNIQEYLDSGMWKYEGCYLGKEDLETIVEALKTEPCEDCINRQAVIDVIEKNLFKGDAISEIEKLSSVQPEQKKGMWITQWNVAHQKEYYCCSECREEFSYDGETGIKMNDYDFCPNCGLKMIKPEPYKAGKE